MPVQTSQSQQSSGQLDTEELFHLAVLDSQTGRHDEAIKKLKEALAHSPDHAKANYFLGAEYAEIGLFERALEVMGRAVRLDPSLVTAHFQLGQIHYAMGNIAAAKECWQPLDSEGQVGGLQAFKNALLHIADGDHTQAIETLDRGIALAPENPALVLDMQRVKANVERHLSTLSSTVGGVVGDALGGPNHLLLSNYQQLSGKND